MTYDMDLTPSPWFKVQSIGRYSILLPYGSTTDYTVAHTQTRTVILLRQGGRRTVPTYDPLYVSVCRLSAVRTCLCWRAPLLCTRERREARRFQTRLATVKSLDVCGII